MSMTELIKSTNAYKIIAGEKRTDSLSHAYLVVCPDGEYLRSYLKIFAKLIMCGEEEFCGECRVCRLIDRETYADCTFYPTEGNKILTADIDDMLPKTFIKPLENKLRLFVLCGAENMNAAAQNKILKTLEEPPKNVIILMGATSDYPLLPTIKSRVKKIEIPPFGQKSLYNALIGEFTNSEKLKSAIAISGGKASAAVKAYTSGDGQNTADLCVDILSKMNSSKDVLRYAAAIDKDNLNDFIPALKEEVAKLLRKATFDGEREINGYSVGALLAIEDMLDDKQRAVSFNANVQMVVDSILFGILEEKYKWQKL